jgi:hypothetical protein
VEARGKTREETIARLAQHIDTFERYSTPHSTLMAELGSQLARMMGLSEADVSSIADAARLHDIGLYAMSPAYCSSSGSLTFEQRLDLWRHSVVGEQQMAKREANRHAQLLVRWHHEWWNGTGYPDQLAFEDIPIGARVLRAVELYSALICDRPYRTAFETTEALETLAASAGVECDPYIVAALLSLLESLKDLPAVEPSPEPAHLFQRAQIIAPPEAGYHNQPSVEEQKMDSAVSADSLPAVELDTPSSEGEPLNEVAAERSVGDSPGSYSDMRSLPEKLIDRARTRERTEQLVADWQGWTATRYNRKTLLGFEASVLRQIEFRSIAVPYWSTARLDWYLKSWEKQIFANDPSVWCSIAAKAMVEATTPLAEDDISRLLEDVYVPGVRLQNAELKRWFGETDAWWMDNLRKNVDRLDDENSRAQALLLGMQTGDYTLSFDEKSRDLRQPLTTLFWRLAGRSVTVPGSPRNHSSNLPAEEFIRQTRADMIYLKLPPASSWTSGSKMRSAWRESWVTGGAPPQKEAKREPQSKGSYLACIDRLLKLASHIGSWAVGYQENGLASAHDVAEVIKEHRPIRATYSKDLTEVLGGLRSFIIVADTTAKS